MAPACSKHDTHRNHCVLPQCALLFKMEQVLMAGLAKDTFCGFMLMGWRFEYLLDSSLDVLWIPLVHVGLPIFCCVAVFLGDDWSVLLVAILKARFLEWSNALCTCLFDNQFFGLCCSCCNPCESLWKKCRAKSLESENCNGALHHCLELRMCLLKVLGTHETVL